MEPQRIVKVALPAHLVEEMDREVARHPAYDRATFIADAIQGFIAELQADGDDSSTLHREDAIARPSATMYSTMHRLAAAAPAPVSGPVPGLALQAPPPDVATVPFSPEPSGELTWGMHNRDWPSLWAASQLGAVSVDGPVPFDSWVEEVADAAFRVAAANHDPQLDLSGLPTDRNNKLERSMGRFRGFFVGDAPGKGPLFSLALAGPARKAGTVLLSEPGADLLRRLAGLEPRNTPVRDDWRAAFLAHLAAFVPVDFEFLGTVIDLILEGRVKRMDLLQAVAKTHKTWTEQTVATNVAGFIARGREWHLIERRQEGGKYLVVDDAEDALAEAEAQADELRARYE